MEKHQSKLLTRENIPIIIDHNEHYKHARMRELFLVWSLLEMDGTYNNGINPVSCI